MLVTIDSPRAKRPELAEGARAVGQNYSELKQLVTGLKLHTVCESAACPNIGDCWNRSTATFMILGNVCTRRCGFCAVQKGVPLDVDMDEPRRVAEAVKAMGLRYAVVTSVNRDDPARWRGGAVCDDDPRDSRGGAGLPRGSADAGFSGGRTRRWILCSTRRPIASITIRRRCRGYTSRCGWGRGLSVLLDVLLYAKTSRPEIPTKSGLMLGLARRWTK